MRSIKSIPVLASITLLFLSACAPVDAPERISDRDEGSEGGRLYALHCSACHGNFGRGGVGVPLALGDFLESVSNQYIATTIRVGRPGRVMPAFSRLTDNEVQSITEYIRALHVADEPKFSEEPVVGDAVAGARLFAGLCIKCHGVNGEGGIGTGVSFSRPRFIPILAPALNNEGYLASATDQVIKRSLTLGRDQTPMRSLVSMGLGEQNINNLVSYIRSFESKAVERVAFKRPASIVMMRESPYSYKETIDKVKRTIIKKGFSVIREELLGEGIVDPDAGDRTQHVVYFASMMMISDGLAHDPRMGLFLPAKILIVEKDNVVKVLANNPEQYSALFNNIALSKFSEILYSDYQAILQEATL